MYHRLNPEHELHNQVVLTSRAHKPPTVHTHHSEAGCGDIGRERGPIRGFRR